MLYWPEFTFDFRLDLQRLLPHIAAIESHNESALNRVLPPYWREKSELEQSFAPELGKQKSDKPMPIAVRKQQLLVRNAGATMAWVRERCSHGNSPLVLEDILTMHRMVAEESGVYNNAAGVLRTHGVQVGRREVGGLHVGAPVEKLPLLMDLYTQFIHSARLRSLPPIFHALVAHFFFTTIHPFDDGNGRVSRLVSAAILFERGYKGHGFYALSAYFYQNEIEYHTLLHQCWQQPLPFDLTRFVAFGVEGLTLELQNIRTFVKMKLNRTGEREILTQALKKQKHRVSKAEFQCEWPQIYAEARRRKNLKLDRSRPRLR